MQAQFEVEKKGGYLIVSITGKSGYIRIKADDDGVVVDILKDIGDETIASSWATYSEMAQESQNET